MARDGLRKGKKRLSLRSTQEQSERVGSVVDAAAISFLRPLTDVESSMVREALNSDEGAEVMAKSGSDTIQRESMRRLRPGKWLNDEVIHFFYLLLAIRDAKEASGLNGTPKRRSHFFKSFFITKLLDEGVTNRYTYSNVKKWSESVPGKDIFGLNKVFVPFNLSNVHWACVVIFMQERRIQFYDSMGGGGMYYMRAILQYLKDEWARKNNGKELPHLSEWKLVTCTSDTPRQTNCFDCGVFTCMFADFLSMDYPLSFTQEHATRYRERIALSILQGCVI